MVLVDYQIDKLQCEMATNPQSNPLIEPYNRECVTNIGYDICAKEFATSGNSSKTATAITLCPDESAFVISEEIVNVPDDMLVQVYLKNSRIRQGLSLASPIYQPGHRTRIIFRLTNVSTSEIELSAKEKYAIITFEKLASKPNNPYNGAFSDEFNFIGLGEYRDKYEKQVREIKRETENLKSVERSIYSNVLTILSVFVALFSILSINASLLAAAADSRFYIMVNFVLLGSISFFVALIGAILNKKNKIPLVASIIFFAISLVVFLLR